MSAAPITAKTLALGIASAALLAGCAAAPKPTAQELAIINTATQPILPASAAERAEIEKHELLTQAKFWTNEYDKNPNDYEVALKYARVLRAIGSSPRASEVSAQALAMKPGDVELSMIYAQSSLDQGKPEDAAQALARAEREGQNDWRVLSIIGVTMDSLDQHAGAQDYYRRAIALSPDNPRIMSNLALSYALEGKPGMAEETLRAAMKLPEADNRIKQNLIMVLGVQGKFDEVEKIAGVDMPKVLVEANKDYYKSMLTPSRTWTTLRGAQ